MGVPPLIKSLDMKTSWVIIFCFKRKINGNISFNLRESKKNGEVEKI